MRGLCLLLVGLAAHAVAGPVERAIPSEQAMRAAYGKRGVPEVTRQVFPMEWEGRRYRIFVSAPKDGPPPPQGYPVLYVTDGNGTFDTAAQASLAQSSYPEVTGVGPAIVVGIGYETDLAFPPMRAYDLSPPDPLASQRDLPHERVFGSGGADLLLDFIERGLGPEIARRHPVDTTRLGVFGHSRGGLFVLHALFTRPHLFRYYIAASPAIWWHDGRVLDAAQGFIDRPPAGMRDLLVLVGAKETHARPYTGPAAGGEVGKPTSMVEDARRLAHRLQALEGQGVRVRYRAFDQEDHISVLPATISAAVGFALQADGEPPEQDGR